MEMAESHASDCSKGFQSLVLSEDDSSCVKTPQSSDRILRTSTYHYGSLVSQYHLIPTSVANKLEQAIIHCRVRAFPDCQSIFDSIDCDFRYHPIVAYEESLSYWAQWKLLDSAKALQDALDWAQKGREDTPAYGLNTLLRVALGKCEVFTKGDFTRARDSLREVKRWLRDVPFDIYTDVQISCLGHYYSLIMLANHVTENFDDQSFREIPLVPGNGDAQNITQLREALEDQSRLQDARQVLSFEIGFLPNEDAKQEACHSFLEACNQADKTQVWAVESATRSTLAQSLRRAGKLAAAEKETELAIDVLSQAVGVASIISFSYQTFVASIAFSGAVETGRIQGLKADYGTISVSVAKNKGYLTVKLDQMKATIYPDSKESLMVWAEFSEDESVKADSAILSSALGIIADKALEILQAAPTVESKATFWGWQRRNEALLEKLGDVYFLYMSKLFTGQVALSLFDEFGVILRWHDEFQARYPSFGLWALLVAGKRSLALVYIRFEQRDQVIKTFGEISSIMSERDNFWTEGSTNGDHFSLQKVGNLEPAPKVSHVSTIQPAFDAGNVREEWFSEWANRSNIGLGSEYRDYSIELGPQLVEGTDPYLSTLLRWLKHAMTEGELIKPDLECILLDLEPDDAKREIDITAILEQLTPTTLRARLYGSDSNPTCSARWNRTFEILRNWLLYRASYHETKRHVLLGRVQEKMLDTLAATTRNQDILYEAQRALGLVPGLCEEAQQHFKGTKVNWRSVACLAKKMLYAQEKQETLWNEDLPEFREVLDMYKVSLEECRDSGSLTNEAVTLLNIAQHYYHGALFLRPAAISAFFEYLDASDTVYNRSRESWKVLKGWAKVEKLLSAIQEQPRLTIAPLAATVLCQFTDEDSRAQGLWTIVQMAKSNGLGWLMRTTPSTDDNRAEDSGRLDVDYEELPTLTPEELKQINDDADGDVVYVDWYNASFPGKEMPNPIIVTLTSTGSIRASIIPMTWKDINAVVDTLLGFEESDLRKDDAWKTLQKLFALIEPLAVITKPGQTLVFSAIGNLHRIPLHALTIEGDAFIRRNPIVYCSSLTALSAVFKARKSTEQKEAFDDSDFRASLFGHPPSQPGKKALNSLAQKFSTKAQTGDVLTSSNFTAAMVHPELNLLHYHGHVTFQEGDPKDHGLDLDDRRFNLRDVFDLSPLPNSYHATLLGCGSGMSKTAVSNDVIGLVPAFLFSGAASTISTLWPFDDKDAAMYTRHFYEDFDNVLHSGEKRVVDLAKANQKAVLAIKEKRPALYHWAPFVLNGYWMFRIPGK